MRAGAPCIFPSSPGRPLPATPLSPGAAPAPPHLRLLSYARASRTKARWQTGQAGVRTATRPRPPRPGWPEPRLSSHPPQAAPPPFHPWWERARRVGTGQILALRPAPHPCGGGGPGSPPPTAVWRGPSGFQAPLWFLNKGVGSFWSHCLGLSVFSGPGRFPHTPQDGSNLQFRSPPGNLGDQSGIWLAKWHLR